MADRGTRIALLDRVQLWLADHPGATSHEVAAGVGSRAATVAELLQRPMFRKAVVGKRVVYHLASRPREQTGTAPETDCEFLARVLSDGRWHNLNELLQRSLAERGCGLTAHSRVSDLRGRGYVIEHKTTGRRGAGSWYRMVQGCVEASGTDGRSPSGASTEPFAALSSMPPPAEGSQLVLTGEPFRRKAAA